MAVDGMLSAAPPTVASTLEGARKSKERPSKEKISGGKLSFVSHASPGVPTSPFVSHAPIEVINVEDVPETHDEASALSTGSRGRGDQVLPPKRP